MKDDRGAASRAPRDFAQDVQAALLDGWRAAAMQMGPIDPEAEAIARSLTIEQAPRVAAAIEAAAQVRMYDADYKRQAALRVLQAGAPAERLEP